MKQILLIFILFLIGCVDTPEQIEKYINDNTLNIKISDIKEINRGKYPSDYFIIDENKNSYETLPRDFVRLKIGDSIQISTKSIYVEIIEFY